jgi:hypothetical protein
VPGIPSTIGGISTGACAQSTQSYSIPPSTTGALSYNWTAPSGAQIISGQGSNSVSLTLPTGFASGNISVTASNSCGSSAARSLTLRSAPSTPGTITGESRYLNDGQTYTYQVAPVAGASSYNWSAPQGCEITGNGGNFISLTIPANFSSGTLSVAAVNSCGESTRRNLVLYGGIRLISPQGGDFQTGQAIEIQYSNAIPKVSWLQAEVLISPPAGAMAVQTPQYISITEPRLVNTATGTLVGVLPVIGPFSGSLPMTIRLTDRACTGCTASSITVSTGVSTLSSPDLPCKPAMVQTPLTAYLHFVQVNTRTLNSTSTSTVPAQTYADFTGISTAQFTLAKTTNTTNPWPSITLRVNGSGTANRANTRIGVWFDQDNDGQFESNNIEFIGSFSLPTGPTTSASIAIANVVSGSNRFDPTWANGTRRRLRVRLIGNHDPSKSIAADAACSTGFPSASGGTTNIGETEDFMLIFGTTSISTGREAVQWEEEAGSLSLTSLRAIPNPVQAGSLLQVEILDDDKKAGTTLQAPILLDVAGKEWHLQPEQSGNQLRIPVACPPGIYFLSGTGIRRPLRICVW